jgi:anti-repressor protein
MEEIVLKSQKGNAVTTSILIASKFGKEHRNVMRDILNLSEKIDALKFEQMFYITKLPDSYGRLQNSYIMNRDGFSLLVMGFTGSEALKFKIEFIEAFNKMEAIIKQSLPQTFAEALQLAADQQKQIEEKQRQLELQQPKVLFADSVATSEKSILIADLAKIIKQNGVDVGQNRLFEWLRNAGFLLKKGNYYNTPSQIAMEMGLFEIKEQTINKPDGDIIVKLTTKVTGKGQVYFINKFIKK